MEIETVIGSILGFIASFALILITVMIIIAACYFVLAFFKGEL